MKPLHTRMLLHVPSTSSYVSDVTKEVMTPSCKHLHSRLIVGNQVILPPPSFPAESMAPRASPSTLTSHIFHPFHSTRKSSLTVSPSSQGPYCSPENTGVEMTRKPLRGQYLYGVQFLLAAILFHGFGWDHPGKIFNLLFQLLPSRLKPVVHSPD